jgi:hypothetical protein
VRGKDSTAGGRLVDLDHPRLDAVDERERPSQVVGDPTCGEAAADGVRREDRLVQVASAEDADDRAEGLLLDEAAEHVDEVEDRRLHGVPAFAGATAVALWKVSGTASGCTGFRVVKLAWSDEPTHSPPTRSLKASIVLLAVRRPVSASTSATGPRHITSPRRCRVRVRLLC